MGIILSTCDALRLLVLNDCLMQRPAMDQPNEWLGIAAGEIVQVRSVEVNGLGQVSVAL